MLIYSVFARGAVTWITSKPPRPGSPSRRGTAAPGEVERTNALSEKFERYRGLLSGADRESFEALCFHRSEEVVAPYARFLGAPGMHDRVIVQELVRHACENSAEAVRRAYATDTGSGAEIVAYALASLCEAPGCIPGLISVAGPDGRFDLFECNIAQERGGPINSSFTVPYSCGLTWDSFHFFEDPFGEGSAVGFSTDHLTDSGVAFAQWLFGERMQEIRGRA